MPLSRGARLGPYEILAPLGAGGMGEVYRAADTRLGRTVAIKLLSAEHSDRFEREARAIAALNHPHICALYDIGPDYLNVLRGLGEVQAHGAPMLRSSSRWPALAKKMNLQEAV